MDWSLGNRELTDDEFRIQLVAIAALVFSLGMLFAFPARADEAVTDASAPEVADVPAEEPVAVPPKSDAGAIVEEQPTTLYDSDGSLIFSEQVPDVSLAAANDSVYSSVTGGTYVDVASNLLPRVPWDADYLFWRSGQYSYSFVWGDLNLSGTTFSGSGIHRVDFVQSSNYNGYTMSHTQGDSINLNVGSYIVYSSLGNYPVLSVEYVHLSMFMYACVGAVSLFVLHTLFSFSLRMGVRVYESQ